MAEKKDDRRTAYSKKCIRDALFELMKEKPLNKISVTEICALADVHRSTFYSLYDDIFDLHKKILRAYFEEQHETIVQIQEYLSAIPSVTALTKKDMVKLCIIFFEKAYNNRELYKFIYNQNSTNNIHVSTGKVLYHAVAPLFYSEGTPMKQKAAFKKAFTFVSGGVTAMLINWLNKNCIESPEEIAQHAASFCFGAFMSEVSEFNFTEKDK